MLNLLIFNFLHLSDRLNVVTCCLINLAGSVSSSQLPLSGTRCRHACTPPVLAVDSLEMGRDDTVGDPFFTQAYA